MRPQELVDSSHLVDQPEALREQFVEDGYVFLRGAIDREKVLDVRSQVLRSLARVGWLERGSDPEAAKPDGLIRREADENWWGGYGEIQRLEAFHRLAHDAEVLHPIRALVGDDDEILVHPRKIGRVSYPFSGHPTPPHQDFPLIQGGTDVFTMWVPFGDYSVDMGPLRVLSGSHRKGLREAIPAAGIGGVGVRVDEDDPAWRSTDYRAGDALIFFSLTVHWAPQNEGDRLRLSADYRYQSTKQAVVEGSLLPHMFGAVAGWDVLTEGWSSTRWVDAPDGLDVVDVRALDVALTAPDTEYTGVS